MPQGQDKDEAGRIEEHQDEEEGVEEHQDEAEGVEEHQDKLRKFKDVRELAVSGQETAANKMTLRAKQLLKTFDVGQNATLKVPEFDRGPCDPRNLLVVVMEATILRFCSLQCSRLIQQWTCRKPYGHDAGSI